jgi:DNA ligase (NAD+)
MERAAARNLAENIGATVTHSVSSRTDFLVVGSGTGAKLTAALRHGVPLLTEEQWTALAKGQ